MISALYGVLLLASVQATDAAAAVPPAPAAATETPKEEKKICKRDLNSGTRLGTKRTCLTAAQWRARETTVRGLGDVSK